MEGLDEYISKLWSLGANAEGIIKYAVYDGAGLVADEIRKSTPRDTGALQSSLTVSPFRNDKGYINVKVGWSGTDDKGVANALKARVLEHGTSKGRKAAPFIRPAVNRVKKQAEQLIAQRLDEKIKEYMDKE